MRSRAFRCSASWRCGLPLRRWCCCRSSSCGKETHGRMSWRARQPLPSAPPPLCSPSSAPPRPCSSASRFSPGTAFQTAGLHLTTPAKAGFITGLSVVIVPLFAALILRQPPSRNAWLGVGLAVVGLGLLTLQAGLGVEVGDLLVLCLRGRLRRAHPAHGPLCPALRPVAADPGIAYHRRHPQRRGRADLRPAMGSRCAHAQRPVRGRVYRRTATSVAFGLQTQAQRFTTNPHRARSSRPSRSSPGCSASC